MVTIVINRHRAQQQAHFHTNKLQRIYMHVSQQKTGVECNRINFHECKRARLSITLSKGFLVPHLCGDVARGLVRITTEPHSNSMTCA